MKCFSRESTKEAAALTDYSIDPVYNFANVVQYRSGMKTTKPYTTNARNQVTQAGQVSVGWDTNGNMVTKSNGYTFRYDFQNRLREAVNPDGANVTILYDSSLPGRAHPTPTMYKFLRGAKFLKEQLGVDKWKHAKAEWSKLDFDTQKMLLKEFYESHGMKMPNMKEPGIVE